MKLFVRLFLITLITGCNTNCYSRFPNVLIIYIDDMGYGDLSCYGNRIVDTPNIDALAAMGMRFTNFYVNSPICSPSRVALNTGCYPQRYGIHSYIDGSGENNRRAMKHFLDPDAPTIARTLQKNGFATGHFGKWHMGGGRDLGDVPYPIEYGYDESLVSFEGIGDRVLFPGDRLCEQSAALGRGEIIWAEKHQATSIYVDRAIEFIKKSGERPFFVNLCPNDVHDAHLPKPGSINKWADVTANPFEQKFFAVLEEMDRQVGRLVSSLDSLGKLDDTIIMLASDNGPTDWGFYYQPQRYPDNYSGSLNAPGFTGPFSGRKWSLYEGGIRVPFIVSWPRKIQAGRIYTTSVITAMDIFPTLCSMLGAECPDNLDGCDKSLALKGKKLKNTPPVMWEYASYPGGSIQPGPKENRSPNLAMRNGAWKLLVNTDGSDVQLYNLEEDPGEKNNLSVKEAEIVKSMTVEVMAWRNSMPKGEKKRRWTESEAKEWEETHGWLVGSNFNPSTAINQLETWQEETFDPETINRELGYAAAIGMNCMRVYLHHVAWEVDRVGFLERMERYLGIADGYGIKTIFVFFDDCWNPTYSSGKQPEPKAGIHNSGWLQDPGKLIYEDFTLSDQLEKYVKDVLYRFKEDPRIVIWDLYNEPGNQGWGNRSLALLKKTFDWSREIGPSQPLTAGVWYNDLHELNSFQLKNSDIITYHNYSNPEDHQHTIDTLRKYGRPMICTEYMARHNNSTFQSILPLLKKEKIGAINWGLVSGKTNTIFGWNDPRPEGDEPELWFHDIYRADGTPYMKEETELIRELTGSSKKQ